nr:hypothetical protein [Variovorax boronicumulans]
MEHRRQAEGGLWPLWNGLLMAAVAAGAAVGVAAVVWALYASLDEQGFALRHAVVQPVATWFTGASPPAPAPPVAAAPAQPGVSAVVARQRSSEAPQP